MKREIKFRAWDADKKEMHLPEYTDKEDFHILSDGSIVHTIEYGYERHELTNRRPDSLVLMQFTGLHDKNGKEIYEGDIVIQEKWVSVGNYVPSHGVVKYKGISFTCECFGDWKGSDADLNGNAVVIGNIYENPELLQP